MLNLTTSKRKQQKNEKIWILIKNLIKKILVSFLDNFNQEF
jgi:hypothetical protein